MRKDDVLTAVREAGLARVATDVERLIANSIRLKTRAVDEATLDMGASKIGGLPDLPDAMTWPEWQGVPLSFVAQLRLRDARPFDVQNVLPESGLLYFFYDAAQEAYGANPAERDAWKVLYHNGDSASVRRRPAPANLPASAQFTPCAVEFAAECTLPQYPEVFLKAGDWTEAEHGIYADFRVVYPDAADRAAIHNRLLGHADEIQDDMHLQVQLAAHGLNPEKGETSPDLEAGALDWRLLLQLDSDENAGMRWASTGMLYFWIEQTALQAGNFDRVWLIVQSE